MPTPSLLIVPARFKSGKMYSQIPTSGAGDFTVTRATTATRFGPNGLIASVASGIPRLDYFASGGVVGCPALLVEPSGSNTFLYSTDTKTNWALGASLSSGAIDVIGVSGINITVVSGGSLITQTAGRYLSTNNNVSLASGSTYTFSFLMKKTGAHTIGGYRFAMSSGAIGAGFDVSGSFASGEITNTAPTTNRIRRVEQWGTDVYRCSETFTMTAAATAQTLAFAPLSGVTLTNNSAVGTSMGFAAPQLELGPVPTSFIPTTTAAVTRNADVISVSGAVSGSIGQTEGTIYAEIVAQPYNNSSFPAILQVDDGADSQRFALFLNASGGVRLRLNSPNNNIAIDPTSPTSLIAGQTYKIAAAFAFGGTTAFYINGVFQASGSVASGPFSSVLNRVNLGNRGATPAVISPFLIRAAALYTTRLTNAQLASLTT